MTVSFFIPRQYLPDAARRKAWKSGGVLAASGKEATVQAWIYQTAIELEAGPVPVRIVSDLPESGIVVALSGNIPPGLPATAERFLIDVVADGSPHPAAQLHICQNPIQARHLPLSVFMPHWPQPGLVPRNPSRGDLAAHLRYYGDPANLAPGLADPAFTRHVQKAAGWDFQIVPADRWHDFSETDCVLAVRRPGRHPHKPATKLYNAWMAGVPFVGGRESAYLEEGRPGIDFIAVHDAAETIAALKSLSQNATLRRELVGNGNESARRRSPAAIGTAWRDLLDRCLHSDTPRWMARSRTSVSLLSAWHRLRLRAAMATLRMD